MKLLKHVLEKTPARQCTAGAFLYPKNLLDTECLIKQRGDEHYNHGQGHDDYAYQPECFNQFRLMWHNSCHSRLPASGGRMRESRL